MAPEIKDDHPSTCILPELPRDGLSLNHLLSQIEEKLIRQALAAAQGSRTVAARLLRIGRSTLVKKIQKMGIDMKPRRRGAG